MIFRNIFNIILLALILTTIFITITSYIIFRIRQFGSKTNFHGIKQLDGLYFNRFSPQIYQANKELILKSEKSEDRISLKSKLLVTSFLLFSIIITVFAFENYYSYREEIKERIISSKTYRELIEQGLLKKYTYDPQLEKTNLVPSESFQKNATINNSQYSFKIFPYLEIHPQIAISIIITPEMDPSDLVNTIKNYHFPITLLSPTNIFPMEYKKINPEIAIYGDSLSFDILTNQALFDEIESLRFDLEEYSKKEITSLWLISRRPSDPLFNTTIQNRLKSIVLVSAPEADYYPKIIDDSILIYNHVDLKDSDILKRQNITSPEEAVNIFNKTLLQQFKNKPVVHILLHQSLYKSIFCQKFLASALDSIQSKYHQISFSNIINYQHKIQKITLASIKSKTQIQLSITNPSKDNITKLNIEFSSKMNKITPSKNYLLTQKNKNQIITIENLKPGKTLVTLPIE